jgi:hypothetical protein
MMRSYSVIRAGALALVISGCAKATPRPVVETNETPMPEWTGSLQPTQQRTGGLAVTGQNKAFGSVKITTAAGNLPRMRVALSVAVPTSGPTSLGWAVLPERCGTGDLPLLGFEQFPLIDVSVNGRGQIETDLPLVLAPNSAYHVNIYSGGKQLDNVVTCANLKYQSLPR